MQPGSGKTHQAIRVFIDDSNDQLGFMSATGNPPRAARDQFSTAKQEPPRLAEFLMLLIPLKHRENLPGDLEEEYRTRLLPRHGLRKAQLYYWTQVVFSIAAFLVRPLAGIAGIHWISRILEHLSSKLLK